MDKDYLEELDNENDEVISEAVSGNDVEDAITFTQFMKNPNMGVTAYMLNAVRDTLELKYKNLVAKHGKFKYNIAKDGDSYILHVILPSESTRNMSYDVVIEFDKIDNTAPKSLGGYAVKFFCNSPSFTYTYAYAYNEEGLYIDWLKDKTEDTFLKDAPLQKNPYLVLGYEKFIYMTCAFIKDNGLLDIIDDKGSNRYISKESIYKVVVDTETKRKEAKIRKETRSKEQRHFDNKTKTRTKHSTVTSNTIPKAAKRKSSSSVGSVGRISGKSKSKITGKKMNPKSKLR